MFLAPALGIRAALILSPHKVGVVPSGSCVCHCIGPGILFHALVWFGSVHETVFATKQEGPDVKSLHIGEELVRKPGTGAVN